MEFQIGEPVLDVQTNQSGNITDKLFSEARGTFVYVIKPHSGGRSFMREEEDLEAFL